MKSDDAHLQSESRLKKYYGPGGFAENISVNAVAQLVNPIFAIALGVDPVLVGWAMAIPRLVDAFTDPLMGSISDNWKGRWGRRRPFIAFGAIFSGLCVAGLWWTPEAASKDFQFYWLVSFLLISTVGTTSFAVPYVALGMESASSKNERTAWMAWRSFFHKLSGVGVQWMYWLVTLSLFAGTLAGARVVGAVVGLVIVITGLLPALFIKEVAHPAQTVERVPLFKSWGLTLRDRNFLVLAVATVLIFSSILLVDTLGFFLMVYNVFGGDEAKMGFFKGIGGTTFHVVGIVCIPLMAAFAKKIGKRKAFEFCTASIVVGGIIKLFVYVPNADWWVIVPNFFLAPGLVAVIVLAPSLMADVAAYDEQQHGTSRQGMYAASLAWVTKLALSLTAVGSGYVLKAAGWDHDAGIEQAPGTFETMRWVFSMGTIVLAIAASLVLRFYNLDDREERQS
ncbi:MFS transporter [Pelagicoccus mobilis]|uniref:MFS transporter n=1 Tax=Pelagicoccus mobilis TaxID=415221 RepID=A0A934VNP2_9BACT|nr:MFS transporter [Pelagicoccus mobilis]MBK1876442.1 MFS transporter [Pelagicoccus mobilis]